MKVEPLHANYVLVHLSQGILDLEEPWELAKYELGFLARLNEVKGLAMVRLHKFGVEAGSTSETQLENFINGLKQAIADYLEADPALTVRGIGRSVQRTIHDMDQPLAV